MPSSRRTMQQHCGSRTTSPSHSLTLWAQLRRRGSRSQRNSGRGGFCAHILLALRAVAWLPCTAVRAWVHLCMAVLLSRLHLVSPSARPAGCSASSVVQPRESLSTWCLFALLLCADTKAAWTSAAKHTVRLEQLKQHAGGSAVAVSTESLLHAWHGIRMTLSTLQPPKPHILLPTSTALVAVASTDARVCWVC